MRFRTSLMLVLILAWPALGQTSSIINSRHNLSASGPGSIRATSEEQVCIFCHTPHNASPVRPLWNRNTPPNAYTVYSSSSLQAKPGQPTGSSKLCLSCHDGTIAIGSVLSRGEQIQMAGGITTLPPGASNLGTDLSDDHPISFRYDLALMGKNPKLKSPAALPANCKLDANQELQCSTCHDAHDNTFGNFLVMDNSNSQLCKTCHNPGQTDVNWHNQCASCHTPHTAPSKAFLLSGLTVTDTCIKCHAGLNGASQGANIAADLNKISRHDTHSPVDQPGHIPGNITCSDCHEPHTMKTGIATAPNIQPNLGEISGINSSGSAITRSQYQFEVCFKCHGDQASVAPAISRQIVQNNARLEFSPSAISYHPVEAAGKNTTKVPSLKPGLTTASIIYCSDCHSSDTGKTAGGSGASGPHGSNNGPLLLARYDTADFTSESASAYALCYRCHDRNQILANTSFPDHSRHIVDQRTPCSACHDSHGISSAQGTANRNAHLINFDISIVQPDPVSHKIEYNAASSTCTLMCHNHDHGGNQKVLIRKPAPRHRR